MMCCGQVPPLGAHAIFANRLTLTALQDSRDSGFLSPLFTACGRLCPAVDGLCPNRRLFADGFGINTALLFIP
jgi:hypothetical protein